jgi:hypothetical protein
MPAFFTAWKPKSVAQLVRLETILQATGWNPIRSQPVISDWNKKGYESSQWSNIDFEPKREVDNIGL